MGIAITKDSVGVGAAGAGGPLRHLAGAAHFDGTNDFINVNPSSGNANTSRQVISVWFRPTSGAGTMRYFGQSTSSRWYMRINTNNTLTIQFRNTSGVVNWLWTSAATITGTDWHHVFAYADTTGAAGSLLYIDGVADAAAITTEATSAMGINVTNWTIGALLAGTSALPADIAEFWMGDPGRAVTAADVPRFIRQNRPVFLGGTGAAPFGVAPLFYLRNPFGTFGVNSGTAGNFTVTGALTAPQHPVRL